MQVIFFGLRKDVTVDPKTVTTKKLSNGQVEIYHNGKLLAIAEPKEVQDLRDLLAAV